MVQISNPREKMTSEISELEKDRDELQQKIIVAQHQYDQARATQKKDGVYIDPTEWANLKCLIRESTTHLHLLNRRIKESKGEGNGFLFKQAAKQLLDQDTYNSIVEFGNKLSKKHKVYQN